MYTYDRAVFLICTTDSLYKMANFIFATPFRNGSYFPLTKRIESVLNQVSNPLFEKNPKSINAPADHILNAHTFIRQQTLNDRYWLQDAEQAMNHADNKSGSSLQFLVVGVPIWLFHPVEIRDIKARKIYFYDQRKSQHTSSSLIDQYRERGYDIDTVGFNGGTSGIQADITNLYKRYGFSV